MPGFEMKSSENCVWAHVRYIWFSGKAGAQSNLQAEPGGSFSPLSLFFLLYTKITVLNFPGQLLAQGQAHGYTASVPGESATQNSDFIND